MHCSSVRLVHCTLVPCLVHRKEQKEHCDSDSERDSKSESVGAGEVIVCALLLC